MNIRKLALASVSLLSISAPAFAQDAEDENTGDEPIVVTGTLIRGTEATGSQTLSVDPTAIKEIAATSTNELLSSIPQLGNFNTRPEGDPRGLTAVSTIVRPNLRDFPSTNATSGALTLLLVDGLRITPVGSNSSSPDPDIVPANILAGLDIVTDGGSSLYGADAVSGVMNFRTLRKFDGIKVDGNYGFGDTIKGYHTWDASLMVGHSWSTGNAYVSVSRAERDAVIGSQVPWWNGVQYTALGVPKTVSTQCNAPQATVTNWFRFGTGATAFTNNPAAPGAGPAALGTGCDVTVSQTYLPGLKRTNVYAAITNEFSDAVDLRITGYWMKRDISLPQYPLGFTSAGSGITSAAALTAAYPAALAISPGQLFSVPEGVGFTVGPNANYVNQPQVVGIETWGVTPELTYKLSGDWAVRLSAHYGRSNNFMNIPQLNSTQMNAYISGGQIIPTNIAAASATVIADVTNFANRQETNHEMLMVRAVADGPLFELPGGQAKIAIGTEYDRNTDGTRISQGKVGSINSLPYNEATSNVYSVFGELHLPITEFADVSGSVRYDHYNTFGSTTNPNIGATIKPTSWLKIYGHWGTSYNAPTAFDKLGIGQGRAGVNYSTTVRPTVATGKSDNGQGTYFIVLTGASPAGLKPQTSEAWSVGFDATPFEGFNFGAQFYSIHLKNALGSVNPANSATYITNPSAYIYNNELTANGNALFNSIMAQLANGSAIQTQVGSAANVAIVVDTRISNINEARVQGVDMHLNYQTDVSFGQLSFTNSAILRTRAIQTNSGATTNELGHAQPRFTWSSAFGVRSGGFSSKITVNYSGVYRDNNTSVGGVEQTINPFVVTNLALGYDFAKAGGVLQGLSIRANVDNLFDTKPQRVLRGIGSNGLSYANWTMGRVFKLGASFKY
ncbi:MAG: TonB-dependent receptor domain-containing protein [Novosphingobium sp.]